MDDIVDKEFPRQVGRVLYVTGAHNVSVMVFSLSSQTSLASSEQPDIQDRIHNYVVGAPVLSNKDTNNFMDYLETTLCRRPPNALATELFSELLLSQPLRNLFLELSKSKTLRFSVMKFVTEAITGPSPKYQTLLEPAVIGYIFMPLGCRHVKQVRQQMIAGRLQKYDYGLLGNSGRYGSSGPPRYRIENFLIKNWLFFSSGRDTLAPPNSTWRLLKTIKVKPYRHLFVPTYNHLDRIAGFDNDIYINFPVLEFLDLFALAPLGHNLALESSDNDIR